jgi:hypothetical protein
VSDAFEGPLKLAYGVAVAGSESIRRRRARADLGANVRRSPALRDDMKVLSRWIVMSS